MRAGEWPNLGVHVEQDVGAEEVEPRQAAAPHNVPVHGAAAAGVATRDAALQEPGARVRVDPGPGLGWSERGELVLEPLQRRVGREVAAGQDRVVREGGEEAAAHTSDHRP